MLNRTTVWLLIAGALVLVGTLLFAGTMAVQNWDFSKLSTVQYEENEYAIQDTFTDISIETDTADIKLIPAKDGKASVTCFENSNLKHSVIVENGTLVIKPLDSRHWYDHISISGFQSTAITLSLPEAQYGLLSIREDTGDIEIPGDFQFSEMELSTNTGDVTSYASAEKDIKIETDTGDIYMESVAADNLSLGVSTGKITVKQASCDGDINIKVSTGKAHLTDVTCENLYSKGSTGKLMLENVLATEDFDLERSTGDVRFDRCDAAQIFVITNTGTVSGSLRTDKVFITRTSTGRIDVPKTVTGGRCEITTSTGDIKIEIAEDF